MNFSEVILLVIPQAHPTSGSASSGHRSNVVMSRSRRWICSVILAAVALGMVGSRQLLERGRTVDVSRHTDCGAVAHEKSLHHEHKADKHQVELCTLRLGKQGKA